jgi:hypothetical protein
VLRTSASTSSAARDSTASANFSSAFCRSAGVASRHDSKAVVAAAIARSTSRSEETGDWAKTSPVQGSTRSL